MQNCQLIVTTGLELAHAILSLVELSWVFSSLPMLFSLQLTPGLGDATPICGAGLKKSSMQLHYSFFNFYKAPLQLVVELVRPIRAAGQWSSEAVGLWGSGDVGQWGCGAVGLWDSGNVG